MEKSEKEYFKQVNIDKANKRIFVSIILQIFSLLTYI